MNCRLLLLLMLFGAFGINQSLAQTIAEGANHSLALKEDGTVVAWGSNSFGKCNVPRRLNEVVALAAGGNHSLALKEDGTVVAWGENSDSQCDVPRRLNEVVALAAGGSYSLALKEDGTVVAWGSNSFGKCNVPSELKDVVALDAGPNHSLALKEDGTVVAWGSTAFGKCNVPSGLKDVVALDAGANHSLALKEDGEVVVWGSNDYQQCDVPSELKAALPTKSEISFSNDPPILSIDPATARLTDLNPNQSLAGNGALDAMDRAELSFIIENKGPGPGRNLYADVSISGATDGLTWVSPWGVPDVPPGGSGEGSYRINTDRNTADGSIQVTIEVIEPNGFSPQPLKIEIETRAFRAPKLEVVDFTSSFSTWKPNAPIGLDILIQNTGIGIAQDLTVELTLPDAVNCYSNNTSIEVASLAPGETIPITYDMMVPRNFDQSRIQASLTVTETFGDYGTTWSNGFPFEGGSSNGAVVSIDAAAADGEVSTERAALIKNNSKPSDVSFNQVPKDIIVTTVAVLPIDGKDCNGEMISGQDIASFTEGSLLGLYNVVERRNLERVLDEQKLALSGLIYEKSAVEAGCNVGAQGIIFTEYGCLTGQETIQLKLVDCQTSELYWSATGVNATAKETLDKVREELEK